MGRKIIVETYDDNWVTDYNKSEVTLKNIFNTHLIDIQHIGSTSIVGLASKPTIDILMIVKDIKAIDELNDLMEKHGFIAKGEAGIEGRRYFYKTLDTDVFKETHHIHVYEQGNPKYQEELLFRDYLRIDNQVMRDYQALKTTLSKKYSNDPRLYTEAKASFIQQIIKVARLHYNQSTLANG
ncbi:MAG: GrpB family protein [Clostridiales bacterium]|nr:GrpB family protein [Clostridiales bacterium]